MSTLKLLLREIVVLAPLTALLIAGVQWLLKKRLPNGLVLLLFLIPVAFAYWCNPAFRYIEWHGFMHSSIVYTLQNHLHSPEGGPEDSLLAGQPLRYPWLHHYVVLQFCRLLQISPPAGFALLNAVALLATIALLFKSAHLLMPKRPAVLATLLVISGVCLFQDGPLAKCVQLVLHTQPDPRAQPLIKFVHANSFLAMGLWIGAFIDTLLIARPLYASLLLGLILAPTVRRFVSLCYPYKLSGATTAQGMWLSDRNPDRNAGYSWLVQETPPDAIVIDYGLSIPALARRSLFVSIDPASWEPDFNPYDGWIMSPETVSAGVYGENAIVVQRRQLLALTLLGQSDTITTDDAARAIHQEMGTRPLYVVARTHALAARLQTVPQLKRVFSSGTISLFQML